MPPAPPVRLVAVPALPVIVVWSPVFVPERLATAELASIALLIAPFAMLVALPTDVTTPVRLALVVTVPAVKEAAVPVMFVPTKALGVPKAGDTKVGLVASTTLPVPVDPVNVGAWAAAPVPVEV